jgi:proteasome alpha subunit
MPEVRVIIPNDLERALEALVKAGFAGNKAELARTAITHFLSTVPTQLQKGYDLETAFSPDGRIFQLEYAMESMKRGGSIVGVRCQEGVALAKELPKKEAELLVLPNPFAQTFRISENIGVVYCGILSDGFFIIEEARKHAELLEKEGIVDIETLAKRLTLFMQPFAQRKDVRPFAVALIIGGLDSKNIPRLFLLNSAGLAHEYKACNVGVGGEESKRILKEGYRPDLGLEEATMLTIKAALREKRKPEDVLVAVIDVKTGKFRNVAMEEKEQMWDKIFS